MLDADVRRARALEASSSTKLGVETEFHGADWAAIRDRVFGRIDAIDISRQDWRRLVIGALLPLTDTLLGEPMAEAVETGEG